MLTPNKNQKLLFIFIFLFSCLLAGNFLIDQARAETANGSVPQNAGGEVNTATITQEIQEKQNKIKSLEEKILEYQKNISYQKQQSLSLNNQINILTSEINKLNAEVELKENQISSTQLEIQETEEQISNAEKNINQQKIRLANFLQEIYQQDQKNSIEIILSSNSLSDYYNYLRTLSSLENKTTQTLVAVKNFKAEQENNKKMLEEKKGSLENLVAELGDKKSNFESKTYAKKSLLGESKSSETKFQTLVSQLKAEQNKINAEIVALEKKTRQKLSGTDRYKALGSSNFIWPVPSQLVTAYFHDPDYPFRYIFEHPAIDIGRTPQGTAIVATASGYVGTVRLSGTNYGYIMLIHGNGFSSVYGHISKSYVSEDEYVSQGDVIGLSGGTPGTTGSGRLSTGPHLHFEIRNEGIPVNPLDYLP